jgi:predicted ArsR family transcriptional regulator
MIKVPSGVDFPEIPIDKKYRSAVNGLLKRILTIYQGLVERFGQDGLDFIREVSEKYGTEIAELGKKRVKSDDPKSVGLYLARVFEMINCEGEITEFSDDKVVIRLFGCPYPFDDPEICKAHTTMEEALVKGLGPNLSYTITKSIPRGDSYCEHVITFIK